MSRLFIVITLLVLTRPGLANPSHVRSMIRAGGPVVVSCAPNTCTDAEEARLQALGKQLHVQTGGRVILIRTPIGFQAEPYAEVGDQLGLGKNDVLLARGEAGWAIRAPGLPQATVQDLLQQLGTGSLESGLATLAKQLPVALTAHANDPAVAPNLVPTSGERGTGSSAKAPTVAASDADDGGVPLWPIAGGLALAAVLMIWLLRRKRA